MTEKRRSDEQVLNWETIMHEGFANSKEGGCPIGSALFFYLE